VKILFVPPQQGYTEELLFYGLREVLGENAIDFPRYDLLWDAAPDRGTYTALTGLLHGQPEPDRRGISRRVVDGEFDMFVVSNRSWRFVPSHWYDRMPSIFLDGMDEAHVLFQTEINVLRPMLYVKRECYVEDHFIRPMPFSYPKALAGSPTANRSRPIVGLFGNDHYPRCRLLEAFRQQGDVRLVQGASVLGNEAYRMLLRQSRCSLDVRGFGYGCLRRFEGPGQGCVPVLQRVPIIIREEWQDGEDAYFYDDTRDAACFVKTLTEDRYMEMASLSWERYLKYHTAKARAEQFLNDVEDALSRR